MRFRPLLRPDGLADVRRAGWFPCLYAKPITEITHHPEQPSKLRRIAHAPHRLKEKLPTEVVDGPQRLRDKMNDHRSQSIILEPEQARRTGALGHIKSAFGRTAPRTPDATELNTEQHVLKAGPLQKRTGTKQVAYWAALRNLVLTFYSGAGVLLRSGVGLRRLTPGG